MDAEDIEGFGQRPGSFWRWRWPWVVPAARSPVAVARSPTQPPSSSQPAQEIPDAPSTVQPPPPRLPAAASDKPRGSRESRAEPAGREGASPIASERGKTGPSSDATRANHRAGNRAAKRQRPRNQISPKEDLYKIIIQTNFVQIPVMVKDSGGRRVDGLLPKDFVVLENGKPQKLTFFTSDPFQLSVAIVLDTGMADVALQKVNQTYWGAGRRFQPLRRVRAVHVQQHREPGDGLHRPRAEADGSLDQMKLVRGSANGAPVLGGPLGPDPPMINGIPVGVRVHRRSTPRLKRRMY